MTIVSWEYLVKEATKGLPSSVDYTPYLKPNNSKLYCLGDLPMFMMICKTVANKLNKE
jgi:hypothetical protein